MSRCSSGILHLLQGFEHGLVRRGHGSTSVAAAYGPRDARRGLDEGGGVQSAASEAANQSTDRRGVDPPGGLLCVLASSLAEPASPNVTVCAARTGGPRSALPSRLRVLACLDRPTARPPAGHPTVPSVSGIDERGGSGGRGAVCDRRSDGIEPPPERPVGDAGVRQHRGDLRQALRPAFRNRFFFLPLRASSPALRSQRSALPLDLGVQPVAQQSGQHRCPSAGCVAAEQGGRALGCVTVVADR